MSKQRCFSRGLSRRSLLRGAGASGAVSMALPWLEATASEQKTDSGQLDGPPVRTAFMFMPNGVNPKKWKPELANENDKGGTEEYELSPMLRPLANVKDDFVLLENLHNPNLNTRNGHWPKVPAFLSGGYVLRTSGRDIDTGGVSADQYLAAKIGSRTPLPSFELGVDAAYTGVDNVGGGFTRIYGSHIAWRDPHTPVTKEIIPQLAFDRLFRGGSAGPVMSGLNPDTPAVRKSLLGDDISVLDAVQQDAKDLHRKLGHQDRTKLDEYLESVRSVERRIESSMKPQRRWINEGRFDVKRPSVGVPATHVEHVRLMLDIMVLAFWTDTTRISTFMFGNAQTGRDFSFIDGVRGSFHGISHHRDEPEQLAQYEKIGTWHIEQLAYLLGRMKELKEGDSTLLDNSMIMFGSTLRDGNKHETEDLPLILAGRGGGTIRTGRRLTSPERTPLCNLYLAMMDRMGVEETKFGTSTGTLDLA